MGRLCYLPTALEARSKYLRAVVNEELISTAKVTNKNRWRSLVVPTVISRKSQPLRTYVRLKC